jgi:TPR repeat protein/RsiW-degrading membrane proteinase PrsW (M82 family)
MNLAVALAGALPAAVAMAYFDRLDRKRPEPPATLRGTAFFGALSAIPCALFEGGMLHAAPAWLTSGYAGPVFTGFVVAATVEELAKALTLRWFVWHRPEFDERMDGIVYATRAGLGFALLENVGYLLGAKTFAAFAGMFVIRAVLTVPMHAIAASMTGYYAARRRFDGKGPGFVGGYALAVLVHGSFDAALLAAVHAGEKQAFVPALALLSIPVVVVGLGAWVVRRMAATAVALDDAAGIAASEAPPPPAARPMPVTRIVLAILVVFGGPLFFGFGARRVGDQAAACAAAKGDARVAACERLCYDGTATACLELGEAQAARSKGVDAAGLEAVRAYEKACAARNGPGCQRAAVLYERGEHIPRDDARTVELYGKGCEVGNPMACTNLGFLTSVGRGVSKDEERAVSLYEMGCKGGNQRGCINLGLAYEAGRGVPKDLARAGELYEKACGKDDGLGCANLARLLHAGTPPPRDDLRARTFYQRGCDMKESAACKGLALLLQNAEGGPRDHRGAAQAWEVVCESGDGQACADAGWLYAAGDFAHDVVRARELRDKGCKLGWKAACGEMP